MYVYLQGSHCVKMSKSAVMHVGQDAHAICAPSIHSAAHLFLPAIELATKLMI